MRNFAIFAVAGWMLAGLPCAGQDEHSTITSDTRIVSDAEAALAERQLPSAIHVASVNGIVTLTGTVDAAVTRQLAESVVADVEGVQRVINDLEVAAGDAPAAAARPRIYDEDKPGRDYDPDMETLEDDMENPASLDEPRARDEDQLPTGAP